MYLLSRLTSRSHQVLVTLLVFSLASGVLGGILFYMDSTSTEVLEEMTEYIPIDMEIQCSKSFYEGSQLTLESIRGIVNEQPMVTSSEIVTTIVGYNSNQPFKSYGYIGVDDSFFNSLSNAVQIQPGALPLNDSLCYLQLDVFEYFNLEIGDSFTAPITVHASNYQVLYYNASFVVAGTFVSTIFSSSSQPDAEKSSSLRLITTREGLNSKFGFIGHENSDGIFDRIWTEFDSAFITRNNPNAVESALNDAKKKIEQRILPYAVVSEFKILGVIYGYNSWASTMTVIALAFSIPTIVMGILLVQYNSQLHEDERRRDIGTLVTRGSSGWQSFYWVMSSAFATGLMGSFGAIAAGALAAVFSGGVKEFMVYNPSNAQTFTILLEPIAVAMVFLFSFTLGLIVALPGAIKALLMMPEEAHSIVERQALLGKEKMSNPLWEILAVAFSGYFILPILSLILYGSFSPVAFLLFASIVIIIFGVFIASITRVLSRPISFVKYRVLGNIKKPSLRSSTMLISRYAQMAKSSESVGVMFIALMFTAGLFSSISAATGSTHMRELYSFDTGADLVLNVVDNYERVTLDLIENMTSIDGVLHAGGMLETAAHVSFLQSTPAGVVTMSTPLRVFAVQPVEWMEAAFLLPYFLESKDAIRSFTLLSENQTNVISSFRPSIADSFGNIRYHNNLTMNFKGPPTNETFYGNFSFSCNIVDTMSASGSMNTINYMPGAADIRDFVIMNITYVHQWLNTSRLTKFYVDIDETMNTTRIIEDLQAIVPGSFSVLATSERIDNVLSSRTGQSINGVYTLNIVFTLVYLTIGVAIISAVRSRKLQKQLSVLRAFGSHSSSVISSILLDTLLSVSAGCLIGLFVGMFLSSLIIQLPLAFLGLGSDIAWSRLPISLVIPVPAVLGIISVAFVASLIAVAVVTKKNLRSNIADDFRHD